MYMFKAALVFYMATPCHTTESASALIASESVAHIKPQEKIHKSWPAGQGIDWSVKDTSWHSAFKSPLYSKQEWNECKLPNVKMRSQ